MAQPARDDAPPPASRRKCADCGLVHFADRSNCRRCGALLAVTDTGRHEVPAPPAAAGRRPLHRVLAIALVTLAIAFVWSRSLLLSSEAIPVDQREIVFRAVRLIEQAGFTREGIVLRHAANFRVTDNWWNLYLGHHDAYAATNFPFEIVTLYQPFFTATTDDTERAVVLLHEAQHLLGAGEESALESVWRRKRQLGWTADAYARTRLWRNTREWTVGAVPTLFACGDHGHGDCSD